MRVAVMGADGDGSTSGHDQFQAIGRLRRENHYNGGAI